jgi:hypothetical protein
MASGQKADELAAEACRHREADKAAEHELVNDPKARAAEMS